MRNFYEAFFPSNGRGVFLDERMHRELADSLQYLSDATVDVDKKLSVNLLALSETLRKKIKYKPILFRLYYKLAQEIIDGDLTAANVTFVKMQEVSPRSFKRQISYFGHPLLEQVCQDLVEEGMNIAPINGSVADKFEALLDEGFNLMREALPDLYDEISEIVHEIVLVREPANGAYQFHGASHYQFWGLLLLNPLHHHSPLEVVEVLAHEAAHSLLFGLTIDEPLVLNRDDELFPSPLRQDLRPMDGIYHATYVSAKMCWAMEGIAASGILPEHEKFKAIASADKDRKNYFAGLAVISEHGKLSDSGRRILASAQDWMARH